MKEIAGIFSNIDDNLVNLVIQENINLNEMLNDFRFSKHHNDVAITCYVAGYVIRGLTLMIVSDGSNLWPYKSKLTESCSPAIFFSSKILATFVFDVFL